jgi:D-sedoheptulose 7-phosphate isomerase
MTNTPDAKWLSSYFDLYKKASFDERHYENLMKFHQMIVDVRARGNKLIFAGNGASASIASHARVDFTKQGKVRSLDFNEPNMLTAFANDFGFENVFAKGVEMLGDDGDVLVLVSVSGTSPNCVKAAEYARSRGMTVVSFTGKAADNPLRQLSDLEFWIDSGAYNVVECTHMMWICTVVDMLIGEAEYAVS